MQYNIPLPADDEKLNVEIFPNKYPNSISEAVERYLNNLSPSSVRAYRSDLFDYHRFVNTPLQNTKEDDVLRYIENLEKKGFANSTINRRIASLSKLCSIYVAMGLMMHNPVQNLGAIGKLYKPVDNSVNVKITMHDIEAVISNSRKKTAAIVRCLINTGLRITELLSIKKEDLEAYSPEYMRIKILGKGRKVRFIYISYELYQYVKDAYDGDSIYLFASEKGNQLSRVNIYKQINRSFLKYSHKAGVGPHMLRHAFATIKICEEKKDYKAVSSYLGHVNPSLTMTYYVDSQLSPEETIII